MNRNSATKLAKSALAAQDAVVVLDTDALRSPLLADAFAARGAFFGAIDRAPVSDKDSLMHAIYQTCSLPKYFGFNWDALVDCLSDFSWLPAQAHVLALRDAAPLIAKSPADLDTLKEVVRSADERVRERGRRTLLLISQ